MNSQGPRRRPRLRLAGGGDRRDERPLGDGDRSAAASSPPPRIRSREREALAAAYAQEHLGAEAAAAAAGFVDEVIEPGETRARLAGALAALEGEHG